MKLHNFYKISLFLTGYILLLKLLHIILYNDFLSHSWPSLQLLDIKTCGISLGIVTSSLWMLLTQALHCHDGHDNT